MMEESNSMMENLEEGTLFRRVFVAHNSNNVLVLEQVLSNALKFRVLQSDDSIFKLYEVVTYHKENFLDLLKWGLFEKIA